MIIDSLLFPPHVVVQLLDGGENAAKVYDRNSCPFVVLYLIKTNYDESSMCGIATLLFIFL